MNSQWNYDGKDDIGIMIPTKKVSWSDHFLIYGDSYFNQIDYYVEWICLLFSFLAERQMG